MAETREARRGWHLARAPESVALQADARENSPDLLARQAAWLASRLGLTPHRARLLADLAFNHGRRA